MIYILVGDNVKELEYEKLINRVKSENPGVTSKSYDCSEPTEYDRFLEDLALKNLFGGRELLILRRAEKVKELKSLIQIIENYSNGTGFKDIVIDLFDEDGSIEKKLTAKEFNNSIQLIVCREGKSNNKTKEYIKTELGTTDTKAEELFKLLGTSDILRIKSELAKIKNASSELSSEEIKQLLNSGYEPTVFELIDRLFKREKKALLKELEANNEYMKFLYLLGSSIKSLLKLRLLKEESGIKFETSYPAFMKLTYPKVKGYFTDHPYALFKRLESINKFSSSFLEDKLKGILETEKRIKSGELDEQFAIEAYILNF